MTLQDVIAKFNTTPFLFVGSGVTRRYYGLPNWEELLQEFVRRINPDRFAYAAYKARAEAEEHPNGLLPLVASLIQRDFEEAWYANAQMRTLDEFGLRQVDSGVSPFKAEIAAMIEKRSSYKPEYKEEIIKLKNISKKNLAGIITTNYDLFFETLFEDYKSYVGQNELVFSAIQGIAEIYKIHGSISKPDSIVITDYDYQQFNEKGKYLAAKLMTIFMEYPIIFIGYSLNDSNIRNILLDIVACLPDNRFDKLQERFVFIEFKRGIAGAEVSTHSIDLDGRILNMTKVSMENFSLLYDALAAKKASIPVKMLRRFKEEIYSFVLTSKPGPTMQVAQLDDPEIDEERLAISIGMTKTGELGLGSLIDADSWYRDIVTNEIGEMGYSYDQVLDLAFGPTFKGSNGILPVCKALYYAENDHPEVVSRAALNYDSIASDTIVKKCRKYVDFYSSANELWEAEKADQKRALRRLGWLPEEKMDVDELENILKEIFDDNPDIMQTATINEKTDIRRLIRFYDYLRWGK